MSHLAWGGHFATLVPDVSSKDEAKDPFGESDGQITNIFGQVAFLSHLVGGGHFATLVPDAPSSRSPKEDFGKSEGQLPNLSG